MLGSGVCVGMIVNTSNKQDIYIYINNIHYRLSTVELLTILMLKYNNIDNIIATSLHYLTYTCVCVNTVCAYLHQMNEGSEHF